MLRRGGMSEASVVGASQTVVGLRDEAVASGAAVAKSPPRVAYLSESYRDEVLRAHDGDDSVGVVASAGVLVEGDGEGDEDIGEDETVVGAAEAVVVAAAADAVDDDACARVEDDGRYDPRHLPPNPNRSGISCALQSST